jgi:hypothetical protein
MTCGDCIYQHTNILSQVLDMQMVEVLLVHHLYKCAYFKFQYKYSSYAHHVDIHIIFKFVVKNEQQNEINIQFKAVETDRCKLLF